MVRYKCRYILCKVIFTGNRKTCKINENDIYTKVKNEIGALHGDYALAALRNVPSFGVRYIDGNTGVVLIRCQRDLLKIVQSAITYVKKINTEEAFLQTIHVGGTIRSCLKFLIRYHRSRLPQLLMECKTEDEKKKVQAAIVESCKTSTRVMCTWERREKSDTPR
ncbi:ribonuclease P/MRP protein subunit POP5-like [Ruditapes philippinarum]|uniref:ribonuclease P/MRP protein subunit POP5-like n=1 Tax=Ruditapes philippinarum TaxID=129788 RepID=UPI00295B119E|nr:ribonuclease P/MRP protein subunit POP5-like [Ruditapes philippinarum]